MGAVRATASEELGYDLGNPLSKFTGASKGPPLLSQYWQGAPTDVAGPAKSGNGRGSSFGV